MRARVETPPWVQGLRAQLRATVGSAWRIGEQRSKAKLDVRFDDGTRAYAVLPLIWQPAQARAIQQMVEDLARQVAAGRTFKESLQAIVGRTPSAPVAAATPAADQLLTAWEAFGTHKVHRTGQIKQGTWDRDYGQTRKRLEQVAHRALDARELLHAAGEAWEPGSRRRQITIQHLTQWLRWAVDADLLAADRWSPPAVLRPYVGERIKSVEAAVPLTDQQILELLYGLPTDAAGHRWRFALQLMAAYGLRPVEVMHLRLTPTGQLWCDYCKRSGGGTTKPRQLRALHPEWEVDWDLLDRIGGVEQLPPFGGGVADAARRYLARQAVWKPLFDAGATPYGFRHGYALRAHQSYGLSPRVAAALMGHSTETHQRHYGSWTDEATIDAALEAGLRFRDLTQLTSAARNSPRRS